MINALNQSALNNNSYDGYLLTNIYSHALTIKNWNLLSWYQKGLIVFTTYGPRK